MADKVFAPGTFVKTQPTQFGDILKVSIKVEEFVAFLQENANDGGWINLDITKRKEVSEKGYSHNIVLNDFVAQSQGSPAPAQAEEPLPF